MRQGGGMALLHRKEYNTTRLETNLQLDTIEHRVWSMTIRNKKLTLAGIYHPPIGSSKGNKHTKFLKELSKLIQLLMTNYTNRELNMKSHTGLISLAIFWNNTILVLFKQYPSPFYLELT